MVPENSTFFSFSESNTTFTPYIRSSVVAISAKEDELKIEQIDVNFSAENIDDGREKDYYSIPDGNFSLFGLNYSEKEGGFYRVPGDIAEKTNAGVEALARNTSGGRLCFSTNSEYLSITVAYEYLCKFAHMSLTGTSGFSLFEKTDYGYDFVARSKPILLPL